MPLHFFLTLFLLFLLPNPARSAALSSVSTGSISVITTFSGMQVSTPITVTTPVTITPLAPATSTNAAVSIMSFQSLMSIELIFNTTVLSISPSSLQISFSPINTTYFKIVQLHYMAAQHPYIQIIRGCFYCGNTLTGAGYRHQHFLNLSYNFAPLPPPAPLQTDLVLTPAISGIKISNSLGKYYQVTVSASTTTNSALDIHVETDQHNLLQWVCVSIIAYWKFKNPNEVFLRASTVIMQGIVMPAYPTLTQNSNVMFFGISAFMFDMLLDQDLLFQLSTTTLINPTILTTNNNLISVTLEQFFIWDPACTLIDTTIMACTLTCPSGTYAVGGYCVPCGNTTTNCLTCDPTGCTSCNLTTPIFRTLSGTRCVCNNTYYQSSGVCLLCNSSFPNCKSCNNASFCTECYPPYNATPTGLCNCQAGLALVLGVCKLLPGCAIMNNITSGAYCQLCSAALNFVMASNQTCVCVKNATYDNYTGKCIGACVDGLSLDNICDDGDHLDGNGCMNNCTVTPGYHCANPNKYAPSVCVPLRNYTVGYLYAVKDSAISIANLYFLITPDDSALPQMDFSTLVQTTIPLSTLTTSYHSIGNGSGYLLVSAGYTASIQNTQQNLTFFFDNSLVWAPQVDLTITPSGLNYQLSFNAADSFTSIIGMLGAIVGVGALVIAIVSSVLGYKLIGFQIMLPVQMMYLAISELNHTYSALGQLRTLNYSNGYNTLVPYSMVSSSSSGLLVMERSVQFLANVNISAAPLIVTTVVALAMRVGVRDKKPQENTGVLKKGKKGGKKLEIQPIDAAGKPVDPSAKPIDTSGKSAQKGGKAQGEQAQADAPPQSPVPPVQADKCEQAYLFVMDRILITLWVGLIPNCLFSFAVQMQGLSTNPSSFPVGANIAAGALFFLSCMLCLILLARKVYDKQNRINFHIKSRKYAVYLVSFYALQAAVVGSSFFKAPLAIYPALAISTLPVLLQFRKQPYGSLFSLHSLTAIYCQLLPGLTLTLILLSSSLGEGALASVLALSILGAGLIGQGLSIVRLILHLRQDYIRRKQAESMVKAEKQEAELQSIAHETIKRSVPQGEPIFHWDGRDRDGRDGSGSQRKLRNDDVNSEMDDEQEENDEDELARIKMRLKKELIHKRGN